jgi:hypothetical protein
MENSMTKLPQQRCLVTLLCAIGLGTWAAPSAADVQYKFSGFGTLGGAFTNNNDTAFRTSVEQFRGATKSVDLGVDSRLAAQGTAIFSDSFSVTAQVLGLRRGDEDFNMGFEWLYAQYTGVDGLDLKAGRVVLPAFLVSDSRLVGYATPWLRVSPLVYAMMPMSHVDGEQATYRQAIGSAIASFQVTHGSTNGPSSNTSKVDLTAYSLGTYYQPTTTQGETSNILGLNATLEWGDWTFRLSQIKNNSALSLTVTNPAPIVGMAGPTSASTLKFKDKFTEAGLQYDNGQVVVMAEHVHRSTKNIRVQDAKSWYVAAGYRFGTVTPYAMVSQYKESFTLAGTPPPKSTGLAMGARYDFAKNLALKAEWAQYKNNSSYIFTDAISPNVANKKINVMSVALDFVF